jgi:hypothetical protein
MKNHILPLCIPNPNKFHMEGKANEFESMGFSTLHRRY